MAQCTLVIELLDNGSVTVTGPIGNKMLSYGMLKMAEDAIRDYAAKNQSVIVPVLTAVPKFSQ